MTSIIKKISEEKYGTAALLFLAMGPCFVYAASRADSFPDAGYSHYPNEWFQCQKDEDCLKTYDCADIAINQGYLEEFKKVQRGCDGAALSNPKTVVQCLQNKCSLIDPGPAQ